MQPNLQQVEQTLQAKANPQAMGNAHTTMTDAADAGMQANIAPMVEDNLNQLNDQQKAFVLENLTLETAAMVALIGGDKQIFDVLSPYADPNRMLVPVDRASIEKATQTPASAQPAPTQSPQMTGILASEQRTPMPQGMTQPQ